MNVISKNNYVQMFDGGVLKEAYSYNTCIFVNREGLLVINETNYSKTTRKHQCLVQREIETYKQERMTLSSIDENISADGLWQLAKNHISKCAVDISDD